jgi:hypothetical protein
MGTRWKSGSGGAAAAGRGRWRGRGWDTLGVRWGRKRERRKRENYGVQLTDRAAEYLYGKKSIKKTRQM